MSISYFAECTVLVTGASAGIGREFARQLAPVVNTMVLVARRNDRLEALELELKVINPCLEIFLRQLDLREQTELEQFCDWIDESGLVIDLLVNNAGLGDQGTFASSNWDRIESMLQVNISALTYLTYRVLPTMLKSGCGAVLNVSSSACFVPMPNLAVYAATKAYVTSFSEALRAELRRSNISVTSLCPGPVATEFGTVATRESQYYDAPMSDVFAVPVQEVVRKALQAVARDRAVVIPGTLLNITMTAVSFLPMFVKRLILNARAAEKAKVTAPQGLEIPGRS
ncbi:MAG: SDR family oxidoreductase [Verrucomicrobia bacterium]|nr:SDR family oxidoreductase [Verrucomicrobiota bacterium]MBV9671529.1 SDR family oxidoreductase [Verrucomicrobiota bacterium]